MPIFEYKCEKCGECFEKLVRNSDEQIVCEKCGSKKVGKLLSSFSSSVTGGSFGMSSRSSTCTPSAGGL